MKDDAPDHINTRIVAQRELLVDGVAFEWWAVGERPALVTVRAPALGSLTEFTGGDVAACAAALARRLLAKHGAPSETRRTAHPLADSTSVLKKPGWFEPGSTDFSTTIF